MDGKKKKLLVQNSQIENYINTLPKWHLDLLKEYGNSLIWGPKTIPLQIKLVVNNE